MRLAIFGDFDLFEFEAWIHRLMDDANESDEWEPRVEPSPGPDYVYVHVLFDIIGVGITVLLMNVLIGVLSSNYERYEDQSVGQFLQSLGENACGPSNATTYKILLCSSTVSQVREPIAGMTHWSKRFYWWARCGMTKQSQGGKVSQRRDSGSGKINLLNEEL